ncbi:uncharacterized protein A1O9_01012 [Exophiala aquamarina CBS 119918]|uniref:DUF6314 domain-containing protein n=1 Tax=Exophiala aquamarina CBS 119918 TaxID=1182545 RepID=A0A072PT32_9EURO|nr:uncharacterized protein A1O9_01012 [Exophiala aquamarina CBS 119918]KEF63036.1 hypothetical protein A1O9_01012 [Exophiala aquamarina CBS 119918]
MQDPSTRATLLTNLFHNLAGKWLLNRKLHSADETEPSGKCHGEATFTITQPSPVIDSDGSLHLADAELLYHEQGEFEMTTSTQIRGEVLKFVFSRKYIWRLQTTQDVHTISVWFTKPGTDAIDYLFHKIEIPLLSEHDSGLSTQEITLSGSGGHLCVEDFYSSSYSFHLNPPSSGPELLSWFTTTHEVRGPKKDQLIETTFSRI